MLLAVAYFTVNSGSKEQGQAKADAKFTNRLLITGPLNLVGKLIG